MRKVNVVARGLSALQKASLDFAYKRRLERLEKPPSPFGNPTEVDFILAHIVNYYYGFSRTSYLPVVKPLIEMPVGPEIETPNMEV